ncbi:glycosyltransferase [Winogradskyella sp. 3972H.M.0a.05]|uniref:glycosyltransferase family 4 protein n=1 Tax=Winogradskyella sp. 3972H.M.0a.05 TaxID=2950277 RepID=UPI00339B53E4
MKKKQILWILPNYNFYNIQRLNLLHSFFDILVMAGKQNDKLGFKTGKVVSKSEVIYVDKHKKEFWRSLKVIKLILKNLKDKDFVYLAVENKNLVILLVLLFYRRLKSLKFKIFSYNHMYLKSGNKYVAKINKLLTRFYFNKLDIIIFYTQKSCETALEQKIISPEKAFWANNTIDTNEVKKYYEFIPPPANPSILFIGRLIPSKRVGDLIKYFDSLKSVIPKLKLEIIGDGPDKNIVEEAASKDENITWHGAIIDEQYIAPIMARNSIVFIPGLSGLSINHAFAYGRPYITLIADKHGPEISYITQGENGYVLNNKFQENIDKITDLLNNNEKLLEFSLKAKSKGEDLSVEKWVQQVKHILQSA